MVLNLYSHVFFIFSLCDNYGHSNIYLATLNSRRCKIIYHLFINLCISAAFFSSSLSVNKDFSLQNFKKYFKEIRRDCLQNMTLQIADCRLQYCKA